MTRQLSRIYLVACLGLLFLMTACSCETGTSETGTSEAEQASAADAGSDRVDVHSFAAPTRFPYAIWISR